MTPNEFCILFDKKYRESVFQAYPEHKESHAILLNDIKKFCAGQIAEMFLELEDEIRKEIVSVPASEDMEKAVFYNEGIQQAYLVLFFKLAEWKKYLNQYK